MNAVMCVLAFLGSLLTYCVIVLVLSAFISYITKTELNDNDIFYQMSVAQFVIALIVLAIYFSEMMMGVTS